MPAAPSGDPHIVTAGHAPTPFTADEIRDGCPAGREVRVLVEEEDAAPYIQVTRFLGGDAALSQSEAVRCDETGKPLRDPVRREATWRDLQAHASFPEAATAIGREVMQTEVGEHNCLRYSVTSGEEATVFWFAVDLPGMPVRAVTRRNGRQVGAMTMVSNTMPQH